MSLDPDAVVGCLLGQAVGDMMGLPAENLGPRRVAKLFPTFDRPRFLFGHGMGSDDTEHACMTAQALLRSGGDRHRFRRSLAWRLRWWFLACPAGIGLATLKSCVKLWLGWPSNKSGVRSAGNGPAMRAAILGVASGWDQHFEERNIASTRLTHTDPQAVAGARMVAQFAIMASARRHVPIGDWSGWLCFGPDSEIMRQPGSESFETYDRDTDLGRNLKAVITEGFRKDRTLEEFVQFLGMRRGVSGYIAHTVPVAVYAFLKHPNDYHTAIESVIRLGGDTDTVAAITGALVGARVGKAGIPKEWLDRWADWPRSVAWMEKLALKLAEGKWRETPQPAVPLAWWAIPFRNLFFFVVVLAHVFRRMLPPY